MSELSVGQLKGLTVNNNTITVPSGHKLYAPGSIVQVVTATTGFVNQTITSSSPILVNGLSATITPKFASSKILIECALSCSYSYVTAVHVYKNGVDMVPNHGGNNQSGGGTALWTHYSSILGDSADKLFTMPIMYTDIAGSTVPMTYDIRVNSGWSGGANTMYINNRNSQDMLSSSYLIISEVAQ